MSKGALSYRPLSTTEIRKRLPSNSKVTYRMLNQWIEHGLVETVTDPNPGSGRRVFISQEELPKIEVYGRIGEALGRKSVTMEVLFQVRRDFHQGYTYLPGNILIQWKGRRRGTTQAS